MGKFWVLVLLPATILWAKQAPELRIVEKFVEVSMKDDESKTDLRARAINAARSAAIEEANGVSLTSETIVENSQLISDFVRAMSDGLIVRSEILEEEWVTAGDDIRRRVHLRGWVAPPRIVRQDPSFNVRVSLNRTVFTPGDALRLTIRTTQDAYIHVFEQSAEGTITVLLPNSEHPDKFLRANTDLLFPSAAEEARNFRLTAGLSKNRLESSEQIIVIATKEGVDLVGNDFREATQDAFIKFDANKAVEVLFQKLSDLGDARWVQNRAAYRIIAK